MTKSMDHETLELATILDTMADGVFVLNPDHTIRRWNRAMERITGYAPDEVIGRSCALLRPECAQAEPSGAMLPNCDLFAEGRIEMVETRIARKDGAEAPVIASARTVCDETGGIIAAVVTITDVSSLKRLEDRVFELQEQVGERTEFHNLVGKSLSMLEVFHQVRMASAAQVTTLIQGETGTGKELVARAIHYHSDRRNGPLVTVNCSALAEGLLESELFGHVRGAFTGAVSDYMGRFERANGGSILLDEIGDVPPAVQVKLLRVLQEREFERVGDSKPRPVDVRVMAATNRDLRQLVADGVFREDLYYRLKVFPIHLAPLRERTEDIPLLIEKFIAEFNAQSGKKVSGLTPDATRMVMDYCWPGNVRELRHAIEHAFVTSPGGQLTPFDLPIELRRVELRQQVCAGGAASVPEIVPSSRKRRRALTREELLRLLDVSGWNKTEVAKQLGITRVSVWRKMKALGVPLNPEDEEAPAPPENTAPVGEAKPRAIPQPRSIDLSWD